MRAAGGAWGCRALSRVPSTDCSVWVHGESARVSVSVVGNGKMYASAWRFIGHIHAVVSSPKLSPQHHLKGPSPRPHLHISISTSPSPRPHLHVPVSMSPSPHLHPQPVRCTDPSCPPVLTPKLFSHFHQPEIKAHPIRSSNHLWLLGVEKPHYVVFLLFQILCSSLLYITSIRWRMKGSLYDMLWLFVGMGLSHCMV